MLSTWDLIAIAVICGLGLTFLGLAIHYHVHNFRHGLRDETRISLSEDEAKSGGWTWVDDASGLAGGFWTRSIPTTKENQA